MGYLDDQYTDDKRYDAKMSPNAGRKDDPGPKGGEYTNVPLVDGKPQFIREVKSAKAGGTYYIKRGDEVAFDDSKFEAGGEVASIIINPLTETDRGDVQVANSYLGD